MTTAAPLPIKTVDPIISSSLATDYKIKVFVLKNGLKLTIASSPKVEMGGVCIGVGVGSINDPPHYNGLAHFLEHMLFMGSETYPDENEYHNFVSQNGGHTNAYTARRQTIYYATSTPNALGEMINRTADFFVSPLIKAECVSREVEAVHSEWHKGILEDGRRIFHLSNAMANPQSPYSQFSCGNKHSLAGYPYLDEEETVKDVEALRSKTDKELRDELLRFHQKYYSANLMSATIISNHSIEDILAMCSILETIPNKNLNKENIDYTSTEERLEYVKSMHSLMFGDSPPTPNYTSEAQIITDAINNPLPFGGVFCNRLVKYQPLSDTRSVTFNFYTDDQTPLFKTKPHYWVSDKLGYEGKGSILEVLKQKGWATGLCCGESMTHLNQGALMVQIDLTEEGLPKVLEIGTIIAHFINLLSKWDISNPLSKSTYPSDAQQDPEMGRFGVVDPQKGVLRPSQTLFESILEAKNATLAQFDYQSVPRVEEMMIGLTDSALQFEIDDLEHIMKGPRCVYEVDVDGVLGYLKQLSFTMVDIYVSDPTLRKQYEGATPPRVPLKEEPIYKIAFTIEDIPTEFVTKWNEALNKDLPSVHRFCLDEGLTFPPTNIFIPRCFDVLKDVETQDEDGEYPTQMLRYDVATSSLIPVKESPDTLQQLTFEDRPEVQISYHRAARFNVPKVVYVAQMRLPYLTPSVDEVFGPNREADALQKEALASIVHLTKVLGDGNDESFYKAFASSNYFVRITMMMLLLKTFDEALTVPLYDATLAGIRFAFSLNSFRNGATSVSLQFDGFSDSLSQVVQSALGMLTASSTDPVFIPQLQHFATAFEAQLIAYHRIPKATQGYKAVLNRVVNDLLPCQWYHFEITSVLDTLASLSIETVFPLFLKLSKVWLVGSKMDAIVIGNIQEGEIVQKCAFNEFLVAMRPPKTAPIQLENVKVTLRGVPMSQRLNFRVLDNVVEGGKIGIPTIRERSDNDEDPNSAIGLVFVTDTKNTHVCANGDKESLSCVEEADSVHIMAAVNILRQWINTKVFDELRTKQQLGYVVTATLQEFSSSVYPVILIQSQYARKAVIDRLLKFLEDYLYPEQHSATAVPQMTEEDFDRYRQSVMTLLKEQPKSLGTVFARTVTEIRTSRYDFKRRQRQVEYLSTVQFSQFIDLLATIVAKPMMHIIEGTASEDREDADGETDTYGRFVLVRTERDELWGKLI